MDFFSIKPNNITLVLFGKILTNYFQKKGAKQPLCSFFEAAGMWLHYMVQN